MLVMQNVSRPAGEPIKAGPLCPNCGRSMHMARLAPQPASLTDVRVYRCGECGVSLAEAAQDRPATSRMNA
jgi:ribosomal protein S27AE